MDALVLSGGSLKGSYQAGAIRCLLGTGFRPDIVTGISVGSLNAAYLAAFHDEDGWPGVGENLTAFWRQTIDGPSDIVKKRPWYEMAYRVVAKKWDGLVSTAPMEALVRHTFQGVFPKASGVAVRVGAVNLRTGALEYHAPDSPTFLDAVLASTAEPVTMPARRIGPDLYCDGGVREITPLAQAIQLGATRIVCIVCQPEALPEAGGPWGDVMNLIGRETTIVSNEIVANDLRVCGWVNRMVAAGIAPEKRHVEVTVIRPAKELAIDLQAFGPADIARMVAQGDADAARVLVPVASEPGLAA